MALSLQPTILTGQMGSWARHLPSPPRYLPYQRAPSVGLAAAQLPFLLGRASGSPVPVACGMGLCEQPVPVLAVSLIPWETEVLLPRAVLSPTWVRPSPHTPSLGRLGSGEGSQELGGAGTSSQWGRFCSPKKSSWPSRLALHPRCQAAWETSFQKAHLQAFPLGLVSDRLSGLCLVLLPRAAALPGQGRWPLLAPGLV